MYKDPLTNHFRIFLTERPAISPDRLARELDYDRTNLQKIIIGKRNIPRARRGDFKEIMMKYGYHFEENWSNKANNYGKGI